MDLINRFDDVKDERAYRRRERAARVMPTRVVALIGIVTLLAFYMMTPTFASNDALVTYNLTKVALIAALALFCYLVGTKYYLHWRWIDLVALSFITVTSAILVMTLTQSEKFEGDSFFDLSALYLGMLLVAAGIVMVANVRYFLLYACAVTASYCGYLYLLDMPVFDKMRSAADISIFLALAVFSNWETDRRARAIYSSHKLLDIERKKTEALLYNVLPKSVAERLRAGEIVADSYSDLSVIFVDIVGFSSLAKQLSPGHLVEQLNSFFMIADQSAERFGIEKVKTIGDAYLAVSGGTASDGFGAKDAIDFSIDLIRAMKQRAQDSGFDIQLRIGIHSGPVVGGVVGSSRLTYDYWGDTMNIASRIEGASEPNGIAVSSQTYFQCATHVKFSPPENLMLKGVGETQIYRVLFEDVPGQS